MKYCWVYSVLQTRQTYFWPQVICPDASGGGLPEVKTVLSGVSKESTLSFRMLMAKVRLYRVLSLHLKSVSHFYSATFRALMAWHEHLPPALSYPQMIGNSMASAAGLSVGREGPFVHMSCCIANLMMKIPCFNHIRVNDAKRIEILGCELQGVLPRPTSAHTKRFRTFGGVCCLSNVANFNHLTLLHSVTNRC